MIGSLRGVLLQRLTETEILLEVSGVGYRVQVMPTTWASLGENGSEIFVHVVHHVREDSEQLFGFLTLDERMLFETLLSAHGVGPSLAMAILSVHPPVNLVQAVQNNDIDSLCLVPGVGKKTAQRLLLELSSKLDISVTESTTSLTTEQNGVMKDVRDALSALGYGSEEIASALRELPSSDDTAELVRLALQKLDS